MKQGIGFVFLATLIALVNPCYCFVPRGGAKTQATQIRPARPTLAHALPIRDSYTKIGAANRNAGGEKLFGKSKKKEPSEDGGDSEEMTPFERVASMGLAGVLAIAVAESIFWALGMPLAEVYYKFTTGEWIDLTTTDGQLKAAGFSFGYGGFATVILQYRVTLFAIPLVPIMDKYIAQPLMSGGVIKADDD